MPSARCLIGFCLLIRASASNALAAPHCNGRRRSGRLRPRRRALGHQASTSIRCGAAENERDGSSKRLSPASIAGWYMQQLEAHELPTKFVSSGFLSLVGDVFAQKMEHRMKAKEQIIGGVITTAALDKRRLVAMFVDGLVCTGPLLHYVYELYEKILPTQTYVGQIEDESAARRRLLATLTHVLFDNFIMVFFYVGVLMVSTAMMEGRSSAIPQELRHNLLPTVKVSWRVSIGGYIPLQLLSFHYLPRKLRVLAVNALDVGWVTVMSYMTHRNRH